MYMLANLSRLAGPSNINALPTLQTSSEIPRQAPTSRPKFIFPHMTEINRYLFHILFIFKKYSLEYYALP
jgi:hypothetical protein